MSDLLSGCSRRVRRCRGSSWLLWRRCVRSVRAAVRSSGVFPVGFGVGFKSVLCGVFGARLVSGRVSPLPSSTAGLVVVFARYSPAVVLVEGSCGCWRGLLFASHVFDLSFVYLSVVPLSDVPWGVPHVASGLWSYRRRRAAVRSLLSDAWR